MSEFIAELAPAAMITAHGKGITLTVTPVDDGVRIEGTGRFWPP